VSSQSVADLLGEDLSHDELGQDLVGASLIAGYIPERAIAHVPAMQLGDGLAGPPNDQQLYIGRDDRPLAVDELGRQGPFLLKMGTLARHRAGRSFPLNYEWGAGIDQTNPGRVPEQDTRTNSPLNPGELPEAHAGVPAAEVLRSARTVFFTTTPQVGWEGW
jgi:hypothetical protein